MRCFSDYNSSLYSSSIWCLNSAGNRVLLSCFEKVNAFIFHFFMYFSPLYLMFYIMVDSQIIFVAFIVGIQMSVKHPYDVYMMSFVVVHCWFTWLFALLYVPKLNGLTADFFLYPTACLSHCWVFWGRHKKSSQ